jgi:N-ethylmaleimide reductase
MSIDSNQHLFRPIRLGNLDLPNCIVMAPLTRMRAANAELAPTVLHADYYAQRASAGLIISEGIFVSPEAVGWADVPGLWSEGQVRSWSKVTDAVHRAGGRIVAQLWHTGSLGHPDFHGGKAPLSASAVREAAPASAAVSPRRCTSAAIR